MMSEQAQPQPDNYAILLNVRSFVDFESLEVVPDHTIRRATGEEIEEIQKTIGHLAGGNRQHVQSIWEMRWNDEHTVTQELPRDLWRYYVVSFAGNNVTMNDLSLAFNLSSAEPDTGPILMHGPLAGPIHNAGNYFQSTEHLLLAGEPAYVDLTRDDLTEIRAIWQNLKNHDHALIDMRPAVNQMYRLKGLPSHSTMRFLGYFAVLESLLTHAPRPTDPYDSITRQVKTKMALLNNRFSRRLNYDPFGGALPETVWTKLYKYRSLIAHGGEANIDGDLALLQSPAQALAVVRNATKAVARQALLEPQLIADLREC
jgi:hypothetical protein